MQIAPRATRATDTDTTAAAAPKTARGASGVEKAGCRRDLQWGIRQQEKLLNKASNCYFALLLSNPTNSLI